MRVIKFRGKRVTDGQWVYGDLKCGSRKENFAIHTYDMTGWYNRGYMVEPDTIGQFTGLTDKGGKEVYEGDILLWTRKNVHIEGRPRQDFSDKCVVYYDNDKCAFQFRYELRCGACVGYLDFDDDRADESFVEVIGNVFDDPGLIGKGGQDENG